MLGRKNIVLCGLALLSFASIEKASASGNVDRNSEDVLIAAGDTISPKKKNKKDAAARQSTQTKQTAQTVPSADSVRITTEEISNSSLGTLRDDEVYIEEPKIRREFVLEEDFKLWRTYIQKGRRSTEYRKVEVPFGTYFKKNDMDITEEVYELETKDLPKGETKRYMRDEYEAKERARIEEEIRNHFQIREIPFDPAAQPADTTNQGK